MSYDFLIIMPIKFLFPLKIYYIYKFLNYSPNRFILIKLYF